ncbi:hypothetical protein J0H58_38480 [bacterium]|nr:hypothetical protein [bacterium]
MTIARFGKIVPIQGDVLLLIGYRLTMAQATVALPDPERLTNMRQGRDRLRQRTGQDFGFDLAAWHTYLSAHPEYGYTHPYAFAGVRLAVEEAIPDVERLRLVALLQGASSPAVIEPTCDKERGSAEPHAAADRGLGSGL